MFFSISIRFRLFYRTNDFEAHSLVDFDFFLSQIAEKIYDELETPTECRKNFKKCKLCGGTELMNEKLVVSDTASAGGGANGVGTGGGATSMSSPATSSVIFRSISFRREFIVPTALEPCMSSINACFTCPQTCCRVEIQLLQLSPFIHAQVVVIKLLEVFFALLPLSF